MAPPGPYDLRTPARPRSRTVGERRAFGYAMGNSRLLWYAKTVTNMPSCGCKLPRSERARPDAFLTIAIA
jgi:hypothetical protein